MEPDHLLEPSDQLSAPLRDMHRALSALSHHVLALDQANQRVEVCTDSSLLSILSASREDEKNNIARLLEWLRRHDPQFNQSLRNTLFKAGPIAEAD